MSILDKLKDLVAKIEKGTPEEAEELQREAEEILSSVGSSGINVVANGATTLAYIDGATNGGSISLGTYTSSDYTSLTKLG